MVISQLQERTKIEQSRFKRKASSQKEAKRNHLKHLVGTIHVDMGESKGETKNMNSPKRHE